MWIQRLSKILWLSLGVAVLAGLYLSRKPLCIDSRVIERLDIVDGATTQTAWRCSMNRDTPWSLDLFHHLNDWQDRIARTEEALWRIEPFEKPMRVVVLTQRPWFFSLQDGALYIGSKLVEAEGHLERGIVKDWVREKSPTLQFDDLTEEVMTDFVQSLASERLRFEDPTQSLRTKTWSQWPQVIKEAHAYCASPWKRSEHFEMCRRSPEMFDVDAFRLSLRPLLSSAMLAAWAELPLRDRVSMYLETPKWLARAKVDGPGAVFYGPPVDHETAIASTVNSVFAFQKLLMDMTTLPDTASVTFASAFESHLKRRGFQESDPRISLDVLVISDLPLEWDSALIKQLSELALQKPDLKIAIKDPHRLSLMPSRNRIPLSEISALKADRVAVLKCGRFDFDWVLSFEASAQKLFVIDQCGSHLPDMRSWVTAGPEGFAAANQDVRFIQFHLPSLALRRQALNGQMDVLSLVQKRDVSDPVFKALGWSELNWSQSLKAYSPRAQVDAIEWFRIN